MKAVKEHLFTTLNFIILNISCSLFQIFVLATLSVMQMFIWLFLGHLIWVVSSNGKIVLDISYIISYISVALIYGISWLGFWSVLYKDCIKWFYFRLVFSIIPLLLILMMFDPNPDPMAMIPLPAEPIFSSLVTAIILLPIYSILIYKFILQSHANKRKNTILVCIATLFIGSLIFYESWNMMDIIYSFFEFKPFFQYIALSH